MRIVGLTGGIASGKSTVGRLFAALGAVVHSADEDARQVLADGSPVLAEVLTAFPDVRRPDGTLNRVRLGTRIFADPSARTRLEAIMHSAIIARMRRGIDEAAARRASSGPGVLVYETPLLYEAGLETLFDVVVAVLATPEQQRERLQARERAAGRDPLSASELAARLTAQLSPQEKARRADHVIRTDGPLEETEAQVRQLWDELVHSSQA